MLLYLKLKVNISAGLNVQIYHEVANFEVANLLMYFVIEGSFISSLTC